MNESISSTSLFLAYMGGCIAVVGLSIIMYRLVCNKVYTYIKHVGKCSEETSGVEYKAMFFKRITGIIIIITPLSVALSKYHYFYKHDSLGKMYTTISRNEELVWLLSHQISDAMVGLVVLLVLLVALAVIIVLQDHPIRGAESDDPDAKAKTPVDKQLKKQSEG